MNMRKLILSLLPLLCGLVLYAQNTITVAGLVVDEDDLPMPGVVVYDAAKPAGGTVTSEDGRYSIIVSKNCKELTFEFMGYKTVTADLKEAALVSMKLEAEMLTETVVTGIYTRKADSFTGAVQSLSSEDLRRVGNKNVLESLKNLDPSLMILENLEAGSNPNAMQSMQIRGASSLSLGTTDMKSNFTSDVNMPLFILDGFETTIEKVQDMDMNRVESITILKDASAKAIYGSKGGNGVIVIETKSLDSGKTAVTYSGSVALEMPDLTSYNLCNALEKLEVERREGFYTDPMRFTDSSQMLQALDDYYARLKKAQEGESTYWLSKPLRIGVDNKHSLSIELGNKELKSFVTFSYNNVEGVMKGSGREVLTGDMNLAYRMNGWLFRNVMSISSMKGDESPYGEFSLYAALNPYFSPYDEEGNLLRLFPLYTSSSYNIYVSNPLYDASLNVKDQNRYLDFTDNFYVEYSPIRALKLVGRFGIDTKRTASDYFLPANHSRFYSATGYSEDALLSRGLYEASAGTYTQYSGDVSAQFNQTFNEVHDVFATAQYQISETSYSEYVNSAVGFPSSRMEELFFANKYDPNVSPRGTSGLNRNLGLLLTTGYSYDNRYMMDATIKGSASSVFGTNRRWGTFWSAGVAWNLHNEEWMKHVSWLKQFKLRYSMGSSGNQNYTTNNSLPVYNYFRDRYYMGFAGVQLMNMENPYLGWEEKMDYNLGLDFRSKHFNITADAYIADTRNMVFSRTILPSTGYTNVSDNLGKIRNKGVELGINYTVFQKKNSYFNLLAKIAVNDNRILNISDAMRDFNEEQIKNAEDAGSFLPVIQYYDGMPVNSIWAVPSLGVDPITGYEIYLDKAGDVVNRWNAANLVNYGSEDPLFNGNFGFNSEINGIGTSVIFTFHGGGYKYNSTLVSNVENVSIICNVDRRIFSDRWFTPGQNVPYRNGDSSQGSTMPTSRFIQRDNVMDLSSVSVYYEFPYEKIRKAKLSRLRISLYGSNLYNWSSIHIERGTSYPFARTVSFAVTATF